MGHARISSTVRLNLEQLESREVPSASASPIVAENFNHTPNGAIPAGWTRWSSDGLIGFGASETRVLNGRGLASSGTSSRSSRAWDALTLPADVQASAAVYADSLIPAQILVRASHLNSPVPTYYAASVTRGVSVSLLRVQNGVSTPIESLQSSDYISGVWLRVSLIANGSHLQALVQRADTGAWLNNAGDWQAGITFALDATDAAIGGQGQVGLARPASHFGNVAFDDFFAGAGTNVVGTSTSALPIIPRHYSHIRIAELAYSGNPLGAFEKNLLKNSVDLVVPSANYLGAINKISPTTPQLIYSNASNIYQELLTDWLAFADAHHLSRELAFYHVAQPTPFSGASASSQPVNWFWNVESGPLTGTTGFKKLTSSARGTMAGDVPFSGVGQATYLGYTEKFREINFNLSKNKQSGWSSIVEYATAVDTKGNPTAWKTLTLVGDLTNGLSHSGRMTFDPPKDWVTATVPGSAARLFYVRIRTVTGSLAQAPVATNVLGRDYVNAKGASKGVVPVFDFAADANHDGYLNDSEYAHRAKGADARFAYESRLFYPFYGQQRYVTNPSSTEVQAWTADYQKRLLNANPLAAGVFLDNSSGKDPTAGIKLIESTAPYTSDYSKLLAAIDRAIAPRWVLANTSNGSAQTDQVVRQVPATLQESALRALASDWQQFTDLAATVARQQNVANPTPFMVIDSLSTGGSPTDSRTQLATLAEYYLVGNPKTTFLLPFGGQEPASTWTRHSFNALATNVGQPLGGYSLFATGKDPAHLTRTYNIYQRQYSNALVLYKPLSHTLGDGTGTIADNTATPHLLNGNYRVLNADGSLGQVVNKITLRNGEGAILIKA